MDEIICAEAVDFRSKVKAPRHLAGAWSRKESWSLESKHRSSHNNADASRCLQSHLLI